MLTFGGCSCTVLILALTLDSVEEKEAALLGQTWKYTDVLAHSKHAARLLYSSCVFCQNWSVALGRLTRLSAGKLSDMMSKDLETN